VWTLPAPRLETLNQNSSHKQYLNLLRWEAFWDFQNEEYKNFKDAAPNPTTSRDKADWNWALWEYFLQPTRYVVVFESLHPFLKEGVLYGNFHHLLLQNSNVSSAIQHQQ